MHWLGRLIAGVRDRFAGEQRRSPPDQKPFFSAAGKDYAAMRRAVTEHGCFVLRGLFDPRTIARLRERADRLAQTLDDRIARGDVKGFKDFVASEAFRAGHLPETQIGPEQMWSDLTVGTGTRA
jgi:hypothetical protein